MASDDAVERDERRLAELIAALDALPDPRAREQAKELLQVVIEVHGAGLARLMEIVGAAEAGSAIVEAMVLDERVAGLLLLHDLHPQPLEVRVKRAVDRLRAQLGTRAIRIELVSVSQGEARLALAGGSNGKAIGMTALRQEIEHAVFALAPDVGAVRIEGLGDAETGAAEVAFIPVASVGRRAAAP